TGIMAGAPCPIEVMKGGSGQVHMPGGEIADGVTETSPVSFQTCADDPLEEAVGPGGPGVPAMEGRGGGPAAGRVVPRGTPGEFCTRGSPVMLGYWNDPGATAAAIDGARWMHSGDLATMTEDGYVNIVGRIKDMICRGGENIYPREIEEFLYTHPLVADVQVIGVPDEKYGEEVMGWVRLREGQQAEADDIRNFCRGKIATYKIPRYIKFTDGFPMTVTGKVQKYLMREQSVQELGLDRAAKIEMA